MSRLIGACLLTACLAWTAGCRMRPRAADLWSEDAAVSAVELSQVGLSYYWQSTVLMDRGETLQRVWHIDENLYCLTSRNQVIVYDAALGTRRWSAELGDPVKPIFTPCHGDNVLLPERPGPNVAVNPVRATQMTSHDVVIFNTVGYALMFDRTTGRLLSRIDFSRANLAANAGGACDGSLYYVGSVRGMYYAFDLATSIPRWKADTGEMISAQPVLQGRQVFVASRSGTLECVLTGYPYRLQWHKALPGSLAGDFVVDDRGLFIGSLDYSVYAFDPMNGNQLWSHRCQGPIRSAVQAGKTNVYAYAEHDRFYAIALARGEPKWTLPDPCTVVTELDGDVLAVNAGNELLALDAASGNLKTVVPMAGLTLFVPNTTVPAIFAASADGRLCCIRPVEAGYVTPEMLRSRPR